MAYVLKHVPQDFIVTEISTIQPQSKGKFLYCKLKKTDVTTLHSVERLAFALQVPIGNISYAGLKDRRAVTDQVCGIFGVGKAAVEKVHLAGLELTFLGFGNEPVHVGDLEGNKFVIVVRNLDTLPAMRMRVRNLFGEQRFSSDNVEVGRFLIKREFEKAANVLVREFKEMERRIVKRDWIGALRCIPRKRIRLLVHAYQSFLWNCAAINSDTDELPIVGFGSTVEDEKTKKVLKQEEVTPADFVVREFPDISAEGAMRAVWVEAKNLRIGELQDDECFQGKKKVVLEFVLPKGSYATEFIRQQFQ